MRPAGIDDETLAVMTATGKAFTKHPFFGSRQTAGYLFQERIVLRSTPDADHGPGSVLPVAKDRPAAFRHIPLTPAC
jgi:hypothetical protein